MPQGWRWPWESFLPGLRRARCGEMCQILRRPRPRTPQENPACGVPGGSNCRSGFCLRGETERLFLYVKRDHPIASRGEVRFAEMNGASFLMVSEVGFWSHVVRDRMPASRFLLQADLEGLIEVVDSSSLPAFATNFSMDCGYVHHDRVAVPFADPEAEATYWFICKTAGRERFGRFFAALEQMEERGEER